MNPERLRLNIRNEEQHTVPNMRNTFNQLIYRPNQVDRSVFNEFWHYIFSLTYENKLNLEEHPFFKDHQRRFSIDYRKYKMRHCVVCRERWTTNINLNSDPSLYHYQKIILNQGQLERHYNDNYIIPLELDYVSVVKLKDILALELPVMIIVHL